MGSFIRSNLTVDKVVPWEGHDGWVEVWLGDDGEPAFVTPVNGVGGRAPRVGQHVIQTFLWNECEVTHFESTVMGITVREERREIPLDPPDDDQS